MQTKHIPYCCTGELIVDFGETDVSEGGNKKITVTDCKKYIKDRLESFVNDNKAFIMVITNSEQKAACKALSNLGFSKSPWMSKNQHQETKVRIWWKHIQKHRNENK